MNAENFCYWLQGFFELTDNKELSEQQVQMIKNHLALVFNKVTPDLEQITVLCGESPLSDPNQRKYC